MTREEIGANARTYQEQIFKILDPERTLIEFNSTWMGAMTAAGLIELAAKHTVARMLERDDFAKRYKGGQAIAIHEFLYPWCRATILLRSMPTSNSAAPIRNSTFWLAAQLQEAYGQEPQIVLTMPLLEGLDGVQKMSKSLGQLCRHSRCAAGHVRQADVDLRRSDVALFRAAEFPPPRGNCGTAPSRRDGQESARRQVRAGTRDRRPFPFPAAAERAQGDFTARFQQGAIPADLAERLVEIHAPSARLTVLLKDLGLVASSSEATRKIVAGAVRVNQEKVASHQHELLAGNTYILSVGKRSFAKIKLIKAA